MPRGSGRWPRLARALLHWHAREVLMHILWMVVVGLIVGALAKLFMPGRDPGGILITMALGIAGAVEAGWVGHPLGWHRPRGQGTGITASVLTAYVPLLHYRVAIWRNIRMV